MLRKPKKQAQTVAEKVSKLLAHPNDSESDDDSDVDVDTKARVVDFDDEYDLPDGLSTDFRKRNVKLLSEQSERYKGKVSSRKELEQEEEEDEEASDADEDLPYEESDTDEEEAATLKAFNNKLKASKIAVNGDQSEDEEGDIDGYANEHQETDEEDGEQDDVDQEEDDDENDEDDDDEEDDEDGDDDEDDDDEDADEDEAIDIREIMSKTNQQAEVQKGVCVQNQLRIWERLLEVRINTQKVTSRANQLPPPDMLNSQSESNEELQIVLHEAQERSCKLLEQLLALQAALAQQHSELRQAVKRKQPSSEASTQPASKRYASALQNNFENMRSYRNEVLLKWDDRTKLLTPGAGLKRKSMQEDYGIIKKIDSTLANREALVEKSQTLKTTQQQQRADKEETGADAAGENSQRQPHVYDDSDFYHQQLRELIEYKASSTSNMGDIAKQFVELQKLRQKMKKKVDTRASKGRKLRYVVHNKLINFMAPNEASDWTEDSKTELYRSLFV